MAEVLVVGSTGLVGGSFLDLVRKASGPEVVALSRRKMGWGAPHIKELVIDFDRLEDYRNQLRVRTTFCALGTTIKKAGTRDNFRRVDFRIPLDIARMVLENGCQKFILISAVGADPDSKIFYNRTKGELEVELRKIPFAGIHILRPSLLLGHRREFRMGEVLSKTILGPLRPLIPAKYRPIHAGELAQMAFDLLGDERPGIHIYEGADLRSSKSKS